MHESRLRILKLILNQNQRRMRLTSDCSSTSATDACNSTKISSGEVFPMESEEEVNS